MKSIARNVSRSLPPSFDLDDLESVGHIALLEIAGRYEPGKHGGVPFSAFARPWIRGAIVESVRRRNYAENTRPSIDDYPPAGEPNDIDVSIDRTRNRLRVREAIASLPAPQRRFIVHRYLNERSGGNMRPDGPGPLAFDALRRRLRTAA